MRDQHQGAHKHLIRRIPLFAAVLSVLIIASLLGACVPNSGKAATSTTTPTPSPTIAGPTSTPSPTPIPLGTDGNPVVMGIVWSDEAKQSPAAAQFIQAMADSTGLVFALQPFGSKQDLLSSMDTGRVSFAWLQPEEYLYASENNIATVAFLTSHYGLYAYGSSVYVRSDSSFNLDFDEDTGSSKSDASTALRQFTQKTPCLVNQHSISGYAYPLGLLADANITVKDPVLLQTHEAVIRAIYTGGICDFGFTYGISGDPRTASAIQTDMPDVMDKVKIAWQSPPEIPSLNLSYATLLSGDIRFAISSALQSFVKNTDAYLTLSQMTNYSIDGIRAASDDEYESLRSVLQAAGIDTQSLISHQ